MKPEPPIPDPPGWQPDPFAWTRESGHADRLLTALTLRERRVRQRNVLLASAVAVVLVAGGISFLNRPEPASVATGTVVVTQPERRLLPDRSSVEMRPDAKIEVNFSAESPGERAVTLTRGAALFQVEKNPSREFVVTAGGLRFRAVGTAFVVDLRTDSVEMVVTEGRVAVETNAAAGPADAEPIAVLNAGQRIEVSQAHPAHATVKPAASDRLSWRVPLLEFNETPLGEVVRLLHEHGGPNIRLADSRLARLEISGALRADNVESLLAMLEANYRIRVVRDGATIELRAAP